MRVVSHGISIAIAVAVFAGAVPAVAADPELGKALYETHCAACHSEKLHTRSTTRIASLAALKLEVEKWAAQTNRRFTPEELDSIAEYLNRSVYRFYTPEKLSASP